GQVWPAALGLCQYLVENPSNIKDKNVLELAGGLGLPSLVAAHFAKSVCCSDYIKDAVDIVTESAKLNHLNIFTEVIDCNHIPDDKLGDVILLSDINYEPAVFDELYISLTQILNKGAKIILSTPQRLMAKPFIEKLLPFVMEQTEVEVLNSENRKEWVSVYILEKH
ncbi:MAG: methyltransferase, partial [Pseudopedobacter saltans]